jgi:hypothetical protein
VAEDGPLAVGHANLVHNESLVRVERLEPVEIGEPELDERPDCFLEPCFPGGVERRQVALAYLRDSDTLFESVVSGHEKSLDRHARVVPVLHEAQGNAGTIPQR